MYYFIRIFPGILPLLLLPFTANARAFIQGNVYYLNSNSLPAVGVKITADGALTVTTDIKGGFRLEFETKIPGDKVRIMVGNKNAAGENLELANMADFDNIEIPFQTEINLLEIFVCKEGQLNSSKKRYKLMIVNALNKAVETQMSELTGNDDNPNKNKAGSINAQTGILQLSVERDSLLRKSEDIASFLASIDMYRSGVFVNSAMNILEKSQDIKGAIEVLNNEKLMSAFHDAKDKLPQDRRTIENVALALELKARLLVITFQKADFNVCCFQLEGFPNRIDSKPSICRQFDFHMSKEDLAKQTISAPVVEKNVNTNIDKPGCTTCRGGKYSLGDTIFDYTLPDFDLNQHTISSCMGANGVIIVFISNHCPYTLLYEQRIIDLHKKYNKLGFPVLAINSNDTTSLKNETMEAMKQRALEKKYPFVYLGDKDFEVAAAFGASRSPHVFILDQALKIRYVGTIDDNPESPLSAQKHYVESAIAALLNRKEPEPNFTRAVGCCLRRPRRN